MPVYEYGCEAGHRFEVKQKFSDAPITTCQVCSLPVTKLISAPAISFKGAGWYVTDYSDKMKPPATHEKSGQEKEKSGQEKEKAGQEKAASSSDTKKDAAPTSDTKSSSSESSTTTTSGSGGGSAAGPTSPPSSPSKSTPSGSTPSGS